MKKIKKYQIKAFLSAFIDMGCVTIDDILKLIDKELPNDNDVVFTWEK